MMPALLGGRSWQEARRRGEELLAEVGLGERLFHRPGELSGGEQQRVAVARALINDPQLVLADEPTGNLDSKTSEAIQGLLRELNHKKGLTFVVVTHNEAIAHKMDRAVRLCDGKALAVP
ncbi:MAG: ABC transporter ATP-binding protein, partial [Nitrospinota bacterium]